MKVIIIYSGKGGVGKTTTTSNIAKTLSQQNKKVFILDADVNTPSMPVIFKTQNPELNIQVASLGYATKHSIYVTDSAIRTYIGECIDEINKFKPDYVLIDTPPSITDVHINLLHKIKPSGLIIVTQPNALSVTDVNRTALFFRERNVNILGIVENMVTEKVESSYSWKILASIPFEKNFNFNDVYENNKPLYKTICENLENLDSVILENKKRQLFDETITNEDIDSLPYAKRNDLQFINISTWDYVIELLKESESPMHGFDRALDELTTERIARMLKVFEKDEKGYFMVTKAPSCVIKLIPGEIGEGSLTVAKSYYGVPRIKYSTSQGEVVLFPYEIKPISNKELLEFLSEGYRPTKDGRYLPSKNDLYQVEAAFGSRVGLAKDWEELYDNIMEGNLPQIDENPQPSTLQENKGKGRRYRKQMTIGDLSNKFTNPLLK